MSEQEKARGALHRAVELFDKALAARPGDVALLERQAEAWHRLGDLDYRTERAPANAAYRNAVAIRVRLAEQHPGEPRFRMALSRSYNGVAITVEKEPEALEAYRRSLELRLKLADELPGDADLLHGLAESFLNLATVLWSRGHREEAIELVKRSIDYGQAGLARRPYDLEFAMDLGGAYDSATAYYWNLNRQKEALAVSSEGVAFYRQKARDNPDVRGYPVALANALTTHAQYLNVMGRADEAVSVFRQAAEAVEKMPDPDAGALAAACRLRTQIAAILAGNDAAKEFKSWPLVARHEAQLGIADMKESVARGFRRADLFRNDPHAKALLNRDDVKAILADMERPADEKPRVQATAPSNKLAAPSPLDQPGRLEEDRFLGELTISLLDNDGGELDRARSSLEALLARIDARRKSGADSPALEASSRSIKLSLGEQLWKAGELAKAKSVWDEVLAPVRRLPPDDPRRAAFIAGTAPAMKRLTDRFVEHALWEQAAEFDDYFRAGDTDGRFLRCFDSALLALARGDVAAYRAVTEEGVSRLAGSSGFWLFNAVRTATLSTDSPVPPQKFLPLAERLVNEGKNDAWYTEFKISLAIALFRAGRDEDALVTQKDHAEHVVAKALAALVHAHAGRSQQAKRWLGALEYHLESDLRDGLVSWGALRMPRHPAINVLWADLLRREAYALLHTTPPELCNLRLLRADALWQLQDQKHAEIELAAALALAPEPSAALLDRARTFETLDLRDRADADIDQAIRRNPDDPRPSSLAAGCSPREAMPRRRTRRTPAGPAWPAAGSTPSWKPAGGSPGHIPAT